MSKKLKMQSNATMQIIEQHANSVKNLHSDQQNKEVAKPKEIINKKIHLNIGLTCENHRYLKLITLYDGGGSNITTYINKLISIDRAKRLPELQEII